jgi:hypothetical protein
MKGKLRAEQQKGREDLGLSNSDQVDPMGSRRSGLGECQYY